MNIINLQVSEEDQADTQRTSINPQDEDVIIWRLNEMVNSLSSLFMTGKFMKNTKIQNQLGVRFGSLMPLHPSRCSYGNMLMGSFLSMPKLRASSAILIPLAPYETMLKKTSLILLSFALMLLKSGEISLVINIKYQRFLWLAKHLVQSPQSAKQLDIDLCYYILVYKESQM